MRFFSLCLLCFCKLNKTWQPKIILLHEWRSGWKTFREERHIRTYHPAINFRVISLVILRLVMQNCRIGGTQRLPFASIFVVSEKNFHICSGSFAFRPNTHCLDNLSAAYFNSRHLKQLILSIVSTETMLYNLGKNRTIKGSCVFLWTPMISSQSCEVS